MSLILLVEDDDDTREVMAMLLRGGGYDVVEAEHGQHALDILSSDDTPAPDLMLLDVAMPVMSGDELLTILAARGVLSSLPVIVISAHAKPLDTPGASGFLRKPTTSKQLFDTVSEWCPLHP